MPIQIIRQDITKMAVDAIVNTTNRDLIGCSGVDLAVHEGAGAELDAACAELRPLELGFAKITGGYGLPCKYIIHTNGPRWQGGGSGEQAILKSCYLESLKLADQHKCKTVAFPLISSGVHGYPKDQVLSYAVEVIGEYLKEREMTIYLCVFDKTSYSLSKELASDIKAFIDDNYVNLHWDACYFSMPSREISRKARPQRRIESNMMPSIAKEQSIDDILKKKDDGFAQTLFSYIDKKGISDVDCYKRANIDKKAFSKIKCKANYQPKKQTAVAFAISLELTFAETQHLLASAGYTLSHSSTFDLIIEYCIKHKIYNIHTVNEILFDYDQELLGSGVKE